jgi:hypothetical protein
MKNNREIFRGLLHIHTTYSYDGTLSLSDFADLIKKLGYDFIFLTEHAEDYDAKKMQTFVDECNKETNEDFLVVPGLEFNINGIHVLGIGIEKYIHESGLEELIRKIHENNGLAVLAHTIDYKNGIPYGKLRDVDFIEIWNPRYGERISPSIKSIKILHEFRKMKKAYYASGGLDIHKRDDIKSLYQVVFSSRLNQQDIMISLKNGKFSTTNGFIELPSLKNTSIIMTLLIHSFAFLQFIPNISKKILRIMSRICKKYFSV